MVQANDGGANVTYNGGRTWSTQMNQPTAALFGLAIDNQTPYRVYAAQNDNTHISIPSRTRSGQITWDDNESLQGGEGGQTAVKPDGSVIYAADRAGIDRIDIVLVSGTDCCSRNRIGCNQRVIVTVVGNDSDHNRLFV